MKIETKQLDEKCLPACQVEAQLGRRLELEVFPKCQFCDKSKRASGASASETIRTLRCHAELIEGSKDTSLRTVSLVYS